MPDEFTGEEVFATQLNEEEYPGLHRNDGKGQQDRSKSRKGKALFSKHNLNFCYLVGDQHGLTPT